MQLPSEIELGNFDKISKTNLELEGVSPIFPFKNNLGALAEFKFLIIWCQSNQWLMIFDTIPVETRQEKEKKIWVKINFGTLKMQIHPVVA